MNARGVSALAGVIHAAMQTRSTAAGIALAVDSAGMLQSPETAAELARLRAARDETVALSPAGTAYLAAIRARHAAIEGAGWHLAPEPHVEPGTVRTMVGGYQRVVGVFDFRGAPATADANRDFVLYAPSDVGFLLGQMDRARDRVAGLEVERHSTNEALDEAVQAIRTKDARITELETQLATAQAERADQHDDLAGALGYPQEDWADLISIAAANTTTIARGAVRPVEAADCQPEFSQKLRRTVQDVQTGGVL